MTKIELLQRLSATKNATSLAKVQKELAALIEDINEDGVLDVQQPPPLVNVARMKASLASSGITRDELAACSVADLIALHNAMPA